MNICVLFSLLLLLAPGGCPIYSIDLSTLEVPNDFQNELTLQSMLSSELQQHRNRLNSNELSEREKVKRLKDDPFAETDQLRSSIEDRIRATHYAAASPQLRDSAVDMSLEEEQLTPPSLMPQEQFNSNAVEQCESGLEHFMGSNLFGAFPKRCFSTEDIALLSARKDFELLVPRSYPNNLIGDSIVYTLMRYFNSVNHVVKHKSDIESRRLLQRAFYDALGGYLRYYLVPVAQVSYYAGRLKLCTVQRLVALYRQCLRVLNTNGNGWKMPELDVLARLKHVQIKPIKLKDSHSTENDAASCAMLDHGCANEDAQNEMMIVPLPHLELEDSNGYLSNIFLPFKHRRIYNLRSPDAALILVKFYQTVNNCYRFQGLSPKVYNQKLRMWIRENLQLHYRDELFYPGLGGILQIYEALSYPTKASVGDQSSQDDDHLPELDDLKDYETLPEEDLLNKADKSKKLKNKNKNKAERKKTHKETSSDRKQTRMPRQHKDENNLDEQFIQTKKLAQGEECIDCDDESYVGYVAAFLVLVFLLLLLLICCCLHRGRKKKKVKIQSNNVAPVVTQEVNVPPKEPPVQQLPENQANQTESKKSAWSSMFKKRTQKLIKKSIPVDMCATSKGSSPLHFKPCCSMAPGMRNLNDVENQTLRGADGESN